MATATADERLRRLLWGVRRSVRYHDRRHGFHERFHAAVIFFAMVGGSATVVAFGTAIGESLPLELRLLPAALVTVLSAIDLVVGTMRKAWLHADLKRRFIEIERDALRAGADAPDEVLLELEARRLQVETDEPPVLRVLDAICHNELLRAEGYPRDRQVPIGFWQRRFAQFFDFREHRLQFQL